MKHWWYLAGMIGALVGSWLGLWSDSSAGWFAGAVALMWFMELAGRTVAKLMETLSKIEDHLRNIRLHQ